MLLLNLLSGVCAFLWARNWWPESSRQVAAPQVGAPPPAAATKKALLTLASPHELIFMVYQMIKNTKTTNPEPKRGGTSCTRKPQNRQWTARKNAIFRRFWSCWPHLLDTACSSSRPSSAWCPVSASCGSACRTPRPSGRPSCPKASSDSPLRRECPWRWPSAAPPGPPARRCGGCSPAP
eukprot:scaffold8074_cov258-Pinguiococcus_pyrenoidosus.AAC.3